MSAILKSALALIAILAMWPAPALAEVRSLSQDWLFRPGDSQGAENPAFDDRGWRKVTVPHDFSIMDKPDDSPPPFRGKSSGGKLVFDLPAKSVVVMQVQ
jgi:beta-galactosidase